MHQVVLHKLSNALYATHIWYSYKCIYLINIVIFIQIGDHTFTLTDLSLLAENLYTSFSQDSFVYVIRVLLQFIYFKVKNTICTVCATFIFWADINLMFILNKQMEFIFDSDELTFLTYRGVHRFFWSHF